MKSGRKIDISDIPPHAACFWKISDEVRADIERRIAARAQEESARELGARAVEPRASAARSDARSARAEREPRASAREAEIGQIILDNPGKVIPLLRPGRDC